MVVDIWCRRDTFNDNTGVATAYRTRVGSEMLPIFVESSGFRGHFRVEFDGLDGRRMPFSEGRLILPGGALLLLTHCLVCPIRVGRRSFFVSYFLAQSSFLILTYHTLGTWHAQSVYYLTGCLHHEQPRPRGSLIRYFRVHMTIEKASHNPDASYPPFTHSR